MKLSNLLVLSAISLSLISCDNQNPSESVSAFPEVLIENVDTLESDCVGKPITTINVEASSTMYNSNNLVNDSGMSGSESYLHTHTNTNPRNTMFMSQANKEENYVILDLNNSFSLGQMYIWNFNDIKKLDCGVKEFDITYSIDGYQYYKIENTYTLSKATANEKENHSLINEKEYFDYIDLEDGTRKLALRSVEDFNRRLDIFFKIYDSWGFKKPIRVFISPCGLGYATHEELSRIAGELYKRGVRYWTNGGFYFDGPLKVINGVACAKKSSPAFDGVVKSIAWNAYDVDPSVIGDYTETTAGGCVFGMHWTNLLRFNPNKNPEQIAPWVAYVKRQSEVFGLLNAKNITEAINQLFYHLNAKMSFGDGFVDIDLSEIEKERVDCHKNEFFISFKKGVAPARCEGGEISLYEEKSEFVTYKVTHKDFTGVRIYFN